MIGGPVIPLSVCETQGDWKIEFVWTVTLKSFRWQGLVIGFCHQQKTIYKLHSTENNLVAVHETHRKCRRP